MEEDDSASLEKIIENKDSGSFARTAVRKVSEPFTELYSLFMDDIGLRRIGRDTKKVLADSGKTLAGFVASLPFYVLAHEALHGISYKLMGGNVDYFGMRESVGGGLLQKIFPWISTNLDEFDESIIHVGRVMGNYHGGKSNIMSAANNLAPYVLTPLGFWLMRSKSKFMKGAGLVIALAPFKNIIGDIGSAFKDLSGLEGNVSYYAGGMALAGGIYVGSKYIADGAKWLGKKFNKEKVKCYAKTAMGFGALAAGAFALGYLGKPNMPIKHSAAESARNWGMLKELEEKEKYDEMFSTGFQHRENYRSIFIFPYCKQILAKKITKHQALEELPENYHDKFLLVLSGEYMNKNKVEDSLDAIKQIQHGTIKRNAQKIHYYKEGGWAYVNAVNNCTLKNWERAKANYEMARNFCKEGDWHLTNIDTSLKTINKMIDGIKKEDEDL